MSRISSPTFVIVGFDDDPIILKNPTNLPTHMGILINTESPGQPDEKGPYLDNKRILQWSDRKGKTGRKYYRESVMSGQLEVATIYFKNTKGTELARFYDVGDITGFGCFRLQKLTIDVFAGMNNGDIRKLYENAAQLYKSHTTQTDWPYNCRGFVSYILADALSGKDPQDVKWQTVKQQVYGLPELQVFKSTADCKKNMDKLLGKVTELVKLPEPSTEDA